MNLLIEAKELSAIYPGAVNPALKDISLKIGEKTLTMIIGPNGAGKTTFLKVLLGFIQPVKGEIKVVGKSPREARKYISYVPQVFQFDRSFPITVKEFLLLSYPDLNSSEAREIISHVEISSFLDKLLGNLSGGQLQRVLIARAMLKRPHLLLLDEPVSGIDIGGKHTFYELVNHMKTEHGVSIIVVSHQLDVVLKFADRVLCINRSLLCDGAPKEIMNQKTFKELFGKESIFYTHKI